MTLACAVAAAQAGVVLPKIHEEGGSVQYRSEDVSFSGPMDIIWRNVIIIVMMIIVGAPSHKFDNFTSILVDKMSSTGQLILRIVRH